VGRAWQVVHAGGVGVPVGPWGRWQVAQPPVTAACGVCASFAWHDEHAASGFRPPLCDWWQFAQAAWPFGAVAASCVWHVAQAGATDGACADAP